MEKQEAAALGKLAGSGMAGIASLAEELHQAIFRRSAIAAGPPVRVIHDAAAGAAYSGVRALNRGFGAAAGAALAAVPTGKGRLADSTAGGLALGALSGFHGDLLHRDGSELEIKMAIREHGEDLELDRRNLTAAFPEATSRLAVFVHGLCETDEAWWLLGDKAKCYGSRLQRDLGFTPLYLRYNTGLRVSHNGRRLSRLLGELTTAWPSEVSEIVLVGHSMGGLVARSACHYGERSGEDWVGGLRHVFCLASPHLGAPLEKAANVAGWLLGRLPETRPLARLLNVRSEGIKDLRFGYLVDEDWVEGDPDVVLEDNRHHIPFLETANYCCVSATLSQDPHHPLGHLVGDLLVRYPSATGQAARGERIPFELDSNHYHAGGLTHFHVLNDGGVYRQIHAWLNPAQVGRRPRVRSELTS